MSVSSPQDSPPALGSLDWVLQFRALTMAKGLRMVTAADGVESTLPPAEVQALSPVALAYIGDAVYELFVRGSFLWPPKRIHDYHRQVVGQVRAEQQAHWVNQLLPILSSAEQDILRRGRNASPRGPKRVDGAIYQRATGFEALIGYLYLTDPPRLAEILSQIHLIGPEKADHSASPGHPIE
jgi:ribonuclease III family protein